MMYVTRTIPVKPDCASDVEDSPCPAPYPVRMAQRPKKKRFRRTYIREWRRHRGLTLEALAARVGKSHATLSRLENGVIAYTQETLEEIATALDCRSGDLLTVNPEADPDLAEFVSLPPDKQARAARVARALDDPE